MKETIVQSVEVSELTRLISEQVKKDIQEFSSKLNILDREKGKPHLTHKQTCEFFGIGKTCLYKWVKDGLLTSYKVEGKVYFSKAECIQLILGKQAA